MSDFLRVRAVQTLLLASAAVPFVAVGLLALDATVTVVVVVVVVAVAVDGYDDVVVVGAAVAVVGFVVDLVVVTAAETVAVVVMPLEDEIEFAAPHDSD